MKYHFQFYLLLILLLIGCREDLDCSGYDKVTIHEIHPATISINPFNQIGFSTALTDSATGQIFSFRVTEIEDGIITRRERNSNPGCDWDYVDVYQKYDFKFKPLNDSLLQIKAFQTNTLPMINFVYNLNDAIVLEINGKTSVIDLTYFFQKTYKYYPKIEINKVEYDSVVVSYQPYSAVYPQVYFNLKQGIVAIRTEDQLWQQK